MPTFADAARKVYELRRPGWRNAKHAHQWIATLEEFVFPRIGARAIDDVTVDDVTVDDVLGVLSPIWHSKPTTAKRVRQRIGAVLTWRESDITDWIDPRATAIPDGDIPPDEPRAAAG